MAEFLAWGAFVFALIAAVGVIWQIARAEQDLPYPAWQALRISHGTIAPGRVGVEVTFHVLGPAVFYDVKPSFIGQGVKVLHHTSEPVPRMTCDSPPLRVAVEIGEDPTEDAFAAIAWMQINRPLLVDQAMRVDLRTGKVSHWLWRRSPIPRRLRRKHPGRWGVRRRLLGSQLVPLPGLGSWTHGEDQRELRLRLARGWPPPREGT